MADVWIRNIDDQVLSRLKQKAESNKRSLQAELTKALEEYAGPPKEEVSARIADIREDLKKRGDSFQDATEEIRKMREQR